MEERSREGQNTTRPLLAGERLDGSRVELHCSVAGDASITAVLVLSASVAVLGSLNYGLSVGYSSPVQSEIMNELGLSTAEYSLFGSLLTVGGLVGAIVSGKLSDYLGRRGTLGLTSIFYIIGWLSIAVSQAAWSLDFGRLFLGFSVGLIAYVVPIYVAEITPKNQRGGFVVLHMLLTVSGISVAYILGLVISWRILALIGIFPSLVQLIGLFFIPESPRWLVKIGKDKEFEAALQRLRGENANVTEEAADIKRYTESLVRISEANILVLFQKKYAYVLTVGVGLFALSQLCGTNGIIFYASSTFESAGFSGTVGTIAVALIQIPAAILPVICMDRYGRRPLLMISASGLCLGNILAGLSYLLQDFGLLKGFSPYLVLIGIVMFAAMYPLGMGGTIFVIISEIYPINIKGLAGSLATLVGWLSSWLVSYAFNFSMEWSSAGTFFILAGVCAFTIFFVAKLVPETKGRTLEEIQASMTIPGNSWICRA
ncbi:hypothetical protein Ancab_000791 [Ancistrocladus abbreviatus]